MSMSRAIASAVARRTVRGWVMAVLLVAAGCTGSRGPAGAPGAPGAPGDSGTSGTSCGITDNHDGTSLIHCTDGTSATVKSGSNSGSCTLVNNGDGTRTITCAGGAGAGDGGVAVTVRDAVVDFALLTPDEQAQSAMSAVITSVTMPADGRPLVAIKVSERHGYGVKNLCEMCHLPGTFDFSSAATTAAYPNMLVSTVAQGTYAAGSVHPTYVNEAQAYGAGFNYNALTGAVATQADPTTLVVSPIVAACSACHDSAIAVDHMQTNGGSFYEPRSVVAAKPQQEECLLCHGPGRLASIAERHAVKP